MRYLLLLALFAPMLAAQDSETLSGSVPGDRRLTFLYRADFGATVTSFSIAANINTPSTQGIIVRLLDLDTLAGSGALNPPGFDEAIVPGTGTANAALSGNYDGLREFVVEIESNGTGSSFSGSLTLSTGSLEFVTQDQLVLSSTGFRATVSRLGFWNGTTTAGATTSSSLQLDLGPVAQTVFMRFDATGTGIDRIELIENTGGSATVLATFTSFSDATSVAISGSGVRLLRVNVRGATGVTGSAAWSVTAPSGVVLDRVQNNGKDSDDEGKCTVAPAGALSWLALLPLAAIAWKRRRARA